MIDNVGRKTPLCSSIFFWMQLFPATIPPHLVFHYNTNARTNPPTKASPPAAKLPAAALEDWVAALLEVDDALPVDVVVALAMLDGVLEAVLLLLVLDWEVTVEVAFELVDVETRVTVVDGTDDVLV